MSQIFSQGYGSQSQKKYKGYHVSSGTYSRSFRYRSKQLGGKVPTVDVWLPVSKSETTWAAAAGSTDHAYYELNDLSTSATSAGQPMGTDQYFALFETAYVQEGVSQIKISKKTVGTTISACVWIDNDNGAPADWATGMERAKSCMGKWGQLNGDNSTLTLGLYWRTKDLVKNGWKEVGATCKATAQPSTEFRLFFHLLLNASIGAIANGETHTDYVSNEHCVFFDPKNVARST